VCWASADHGGSGAPHTTGAPNSNTPLSDAPTTYSDTQTPYSDSATKPLYQGGVVIHGLGCKACFAGSVCSFTISVRPAHWLPSLPQKWELMVHLSGPSIQVADIRQLPPSTGQGTSCPMPPGTPADTGAVMHQGMVLYRYAHRTPAAAKCTVHSCNMLNQTANVLTPHLSLFCVILAVHPWCTSGRVVVRSSCNALNYTPTFQAPEARLMAQWDATVYRLRAPPGTPQGAQAGGVGGASSGQRAGPGGRGRRRQRFR